MIEEINKLKLYKYVNNISYLKASYCKQEIWLTPIKNLNDPFEGHAKTKPFSPQFVINNPDILDGFYLDYKEAFKNSTKKEFVDLIQSPSFEAELILHQDKVRKLFDEHGITSFTLDPKNIPMWTYYANNHQGYCVEFEMDFNLIQKANRISATQTKKLIQDILNINFVLSFHLNDFDFVFSRVRYSEDVPIINYEDYNSLSTDYKKIEYLTKNSVGVKYKQWKHEDEFRLIANCNSIGSGALPLKIFAPFLKFTGVIIGANMPVKYIKKITELQKNFKFSLQKANLSEASFDIALILPRKIGQLAKRPFYPQTTQVFCTR